jgi:outer membrane protein assembly factor BamB
LNPNPFLLVHNPIHHINPIQMNPRLTLVLVSALTAPLVLAGDWPAYRGPEGTGISSEKLPDTFPAGGLKTLWKTPAPTGFSSFAIAGNRALTIVRENIEGADREVCLALDATTGATLWKTPVGIAKYDGGGDDGKEGNRGGDGPRSTPTIKGDRVFTLSSGLVLNCLDLATGKVLWTRDILREHSGRNIQWQNAASPVVDGDLVFAAGGGAGQALLAFRTSDGTVAWKGEDDTMTHATPVVATIHGIRQVIFLTQKGLVALQVADGKSLWRHPFQYRVSTAASPVVSSNIVYCAAGYDVGSSAARIDREGDGFKATELWRIKGNKPVANHWSTPVALNGHLYGMFSFKEYGSGPLKCVDIATGKVVWEQGGFGAGNVLLAGNRLLALSDTGSLVLVDASPAGYKELGRVQAVEGKCWSTPALANGRVYLRSTREGACLALKP